MHETMSTAHRIETLLLWQLHDSLLQAYRGQFFTFQAIVVAVGLVAIPETQPFTWDLAHVALLLAFIAFSPVFIFVVWMRIVAHRGHMVACAQLLLKSDEAVNGSPFSWLGEVSTKKKLKARLSEESWLNKESYRSYTTLRGGPTRWKLDVAVPLAFVLLWFGILFWWASPAFRVNTPLVPPYQLF